MRNVESQKPDLMARGIGALMICGFVGGVGFAFYRYEQDYHARWNAAKASYQSSLLRKEQEKDRKQQELENFRASLLPFNTEQYNPSTIRISKPEAEIRLRDPQVKDLLDQMDRRCKLLSHGRDREEDLATLYVYTNVPNCISIR